MQRLLKIASLLLAVVGAVVQAYPDVNVRMECRTSSSCSGRSNWYSPRARDSAVSANIRVVIDAR